MKSVLKTGSVLSAILATAACASMPGSNAAFGPFRADGGWPTTTTVSAPPPTVRQPSVRDIRTMTVSSLRNDTRTTMSVRAFGDGVRVRQSDGCIWTRRADWFSPSDSWARCGSSKNWHTAQASVRVIDTLYPLQVGATGVYERTARSSVTGETSVRRSACRVTDAVAVERPDAAPIPAFVVSCDDERIVRTTWFAPGVGPVAYREAHKKRGLREAWVRVP